MGNDLSPKQKLVLQLIKDFQRKNGKAPSLGELNKMFGARSITSIVQLLEKLKEKGYIQRIAGIERGITTPTNGHQTIEIPIVGAVACGRPLLAQENIEGFISVDKTLLNNDPSKFFFLRAVGDSMNQANINGKSIDDGDYVLIKQQSTADPGQKICALIDDEATIKVFKRENDFVALLPQSSNPANKPIILHTDFTIQGVVKEVYKKEMLKA